MPQLEGADNIRDLGGLTTMDGSVIKRHLLVRSNHLAFITVADTHKLCDEMEVRKIIDLRTPEEVEEKPDKPIPGAEWINIPVFTYAALGVTHEEKGDTIEAMVDQLPDMGELYRTIVSNDLCIGKLKQIITTIIDNPSGAVLWHCTEGKDRCGLVSAMILSILDVPYETIKADYLKTNKAGNKRARKMFWGVLLKTRNLSLARRVKAVFVADASYFDAAFDQITLMSGSVDNYITDFLGIDSEMRQNFKDKVCTKEV